MEKINAILNGTKTLAKAENLNMNDILDLVFDSVPAMLPAEYAQTFEDVKPAARMLIDAAVKLYAVAPPDAAKKLKEGLAELFKATEPKVINTTMKNAQGEKVEYVAILFKKPAKPEVKA